MDLIITILPVVTKDLPISPRFTPYIFLSRCKFSTLTTRQPMVEFYLLTFPRFPLRKKEHKSYFGKNRTHDFRTSRCAGYPLDHSGDDWYIHTAQSDPIIRIYYCSYCMLLVLVLPKGRDEAINDTCVEFMSVCVHLAGDVFMVCVSVFVSASGWLCFFLLYVCGCVFIKLYTTAHSDPVILLILCHSHVCLYGVTQLFPLRRNRQVCS